MRLLRTLPDPGQTVPIFGSLPADDHCAEPAALPWRWQRAAAHGPLHNAALAANPDPEARAYQQALDALARRPDEPVALSLTLPFCAAQCLICDRTILAAQPTRVIDDYVDGLVTQIEAVAGRIGHGRELLQLHLGGGTVNELSECQLARLMCSLRAAVRLPDDAETTVECDPRRSSRLQLSLLRGLGLRHIEFGVLDLDPQVQRAICRLHSVELIDDVCRLARDCGFELVDLGLMIGLPRQTEASWRATIEQVIEIAPDRITLSHYRHWPHFAPAQHAIDPLSLPDQAACQAQAALTVELLCGAGYLWLGNDQFVLEDDPLARAQAESQLRRNLISYTATPPTQMLGLGAGAVSEIDGHLFWNHAGVRPWLEAVQEGRWAISHAQPASPRESRRRAALEHLFCRLELPAALARDGLEDLYESLSAHQESGLVRVDDDRIVMTDSGRHAMTRLCPHLDRPSRQAEAAHPGLA